MGWIFIIMLSVLLVVYCGVGIFWKMKKLGVTGIEAVPNIEFWRDFPGLVSDGCAYTFAMLNGCFSKGGSGSYSSVPN